MKILIVCTQLPYPLTEGANIRIYYLLRELSRFNEIYIAILSKSPTDTSNLRILKSYCSKVIVVENFRSQKRKLFDIIISAFTVKPYIVRINRNKEMQRIVNKFSEEVDIVQAEFPYGGQYINNVKCKKVLDEHNVESNILKSQYQHEANLLKKLYLYLEYLKMRCFERELCQQMDMILATSVDDAKKLSIYNKNIFVVPNGILSVRKSVDKTDNKIVMFTGLMSYAANVDAINYFCKKVWPLVKEKEPQASFLIVGKDPTKEVQRWEGNGIEVTREVPDIGEYIHNAAVLVAPIRIGSGTRIKILEAMSQGKPVVSTTLGCMGLVVKHGENIYIADEPKEFAKYVVRLLRNRDERVRLGKNALRLVAENYTWGMIGKRLHEVYQNGC